MKVLLFRGLHILFKDVLGAWSRINSIGSQGSDNLQHALCNAIQTPGDLRDRHTDGIYIPKDRTQQIGRLDYAMVLALKAEAAEGKIRKAIRAKILPKKKTFELLDEAKAKGILTAEEHALVKESAEVRLDAVQVDDFSQAEYIGNKA